MASEYHLPQLSIDSLLEQVHKSAAHREEPQSFPSLSSQGLAISANMNLAASQDLIGYIQRLLDNAQSRSEVRTQGPDKFNRFPFILFKPLQGIFLFLLKIIFKDQREVNFNLIESLKQSLLLNQELIQQIISLRSQIQTDLQRLNGYYTTLDQNWKNEINQLNNQIRSQNQAIQEQYSSRISNIDKRLDRSEQRLHHREQRLDHSEQRLHHSEQRLYHSEKRLDQAEQMLRVGELKSNKLEEHFQNIDKRNFRDINFLKNDLVQQKRLVTLLLEREPIEASPTITLEPASVSTTEDSHFLDAFYTAFEDEFRGSREEIAERFQVYLPVIEKAKNGTSEFPILDVGCGRGEWLELLKESQYEAQGIDLNRVMVEECCARGLDVKEAEVISYLRALSEESLGAITGFHIIEHLPFTALINLFDEALRVLRPGGLIIFETPNPRNVSVGSYNFYFDPTHRNPLPSPLSKFVAEFRGFEKVEVMELHPCPETLRLTGSELAERFSDYFYGPQDYAIIGYKL